MKYSSLLFVAVIAVTSSFAPAVSMAVNSNSSQMLVNESQNATVSERKSPRKPKKFKKKSHAYNKKHKRK
ncbi:MAG: hypothetical protein ABIS36_23910 [Chryseolinea sp.]